MGFPGFLDSKESAWVRKIPWRKEWQPTSTFLPGEFHGQRSLAGYGQWGLKESNMMEGLSLTELGSRYGSFKHGLEIFDGLPSKYLKDKLMAKLTNNA